MKRYSLIALAVIVIATAAFAQQYGRGPGQGTPPAGPQSVITGTVVSFTATAGVGMPSLVVSRDGTELTFVLGPFWFLQNAQFAAAAGDSVELTVLGCTECPSGYAVVSVKNLINGSAVTLRNSAGLPLWQQGGQQRGRGNGNGNGNGNGPGNGPGNGRGNCNSTGPDMAQLATFTGTVSSFTGGPGVGRPTLILATTAGEKTFLVAPYRTVLDSGFTFAAGTSLTLTAAPNTNGEWVVVTLKDNATGAELILRDAQTGLPVGGGRRGRC
ncbi:MAG: hypothetical protein ACXW28_09965, partial [Thermoanaerobaculia bacterium]